MGEFKVRIIDIIIETTPYDPPLKKPITGRRFQKITVLDFSFTAIVLSRLSVSIECCPYLPFDNKI